MKKTTRKLLSLAMASAMAASLLTGCGGRKLERQKQRPAPQRQRQRERQTPTIPRM